MGLDWTGLVVVLSFIFYQVISVARYLRRLISNTTPLSAMKAINLTGFSGLTLLTIFAQLSDADDHHGRFLALPMRRERMASTKEIIKRQIATAPRLAYDNDSYLVSGRMADPF